MEEVSPLRSYETLLVLNVNIGDDGIRAAVEGLLDVINDKGGKVEHVDYWGVRKLAYLVGRQTHGYYVLLHYQADEELLEELRRRIKFSDDIMKQMTTKISPERLAAALAAARERGNRQMAPVDDEIPTSAAEQESPSTPEPEAVENAPVPEAETEEPSEDQPEE